VSLELPVFETVVRSGFSLAVLVAILVWQWQAPCRELHASPWMRWLSNLGMGALNRILLQLLPLTWAAVVIADWTGGGLLKQVGAPLWLAILLSLIVLDFAIYLQHRLFHAVPWLWCLHRVHHSDTDFDVTTGVRFHPLEAMVSMLIKLVVVVVLGTPVIAIVIFEVMLNAMSLFNHGNVQLPGALDATLRRVIVTPDMHRVHHSIHHQEQQHNFGFNLSWWDRWLGTYQDQPVDGHRGMLIGVDQFRADDERRLYRLLSQPFR